MNTGCTMFVNGFSVGGTSVCVYAYEPENVRASVARQSASSSTPLIFVVLGGFILSRVSRRAVGVRRDEAGVDLAARAVHRVRREVQAHVVVEELGLRPDLVRVRFLGTERPVGQRARARPARTIAGRVFGVEVHVLRR